MISNNSTIELQPMIVGKNLIDQINELNPNEAEDSIHYDENTEVFIIYAAEGKHFCYVWHDIPNVQGPIALLCAFLTEEEARNAMQNTGVFGKIDKTTVGDALALSHQKPDLHGVGLVQDCTATKATLIKPFFKSEYNSQ